MIHIKPRREVEIKIENKREIRPCVVKMQGLFIEKNNESYLQILYLSHFPDLASIYHGPIGPSLGYGAMLLTAPSLNASTETNNSSETVVTANPVIFLVLAVFTLITVYLSSLRVCKLVGDISPVEVLRLAENDQSKRKNKRSSSVTWYAMAKQNMLRNRKKGFIVMLSIALSMVVVNCVVMLVNGYDF